jgi:hypothetical protein
VAGGEALMRARALASGSLASIISRSTSALSSCPRAVGSATLSQRVHRHGRTMITPKDHSAAFQERLGHYRL